MKKSFVLFSVIFIGFLVITAAGKGKEERMQDIKALDLSVQPQDIRTSGSVKPDLDFGKFPLYFIYNKGQVNEKAKFYAKASRYTLWLTKEGLVFDSSRKTVSKSNSPHSPHSPNLEDESPFSNSPHSPTHPLTQYERDVSRLSFIGANKKPEIVPIDETQLKVNYFIGNDRTKWHCDIPTSQAVLYKNLYKNIDLKVYGIEKQIEYDWIVKPGGNTEDIRVEYKNVKGTRIDKEGNLLIETDFGQLMHKKPVSFQEICMGHGARSMGRTEERIEVEVKFKKIKENTYGFEVGGYDVSRILIIDPVVLAYSTYLFGGAYDYGQEIAVDSSGYVYVTGYTNGATFPTLNQFQTYQGYYDVFVTKIDTTESGASSLIYSTFLGGSSEDRGYGIVVDGSGNAYVTGYTDSSDFPTLNQFQTYQGNYDVFVAKIDTTRNGTSSLIYSTYLGGSAAEHGYGIAVDGSGNAYVTGDTWSSNFPILHQFQTDQPTIDAFVSKIDTTEIGASSLIYSTYLGGSNSDHSYGIAVDGNGDAYVAGRTFSQDFPTLNQYQADPGDYTYDAFVTRIDTNRNGASSLIYSTYLGGTSTDSGSAIAVDSSGNAYVAGYTESGNFPTLNQYQINQPDRDVFVSKIDTTQAGTPGLIYSTYLGGSGKDRCFGIAVDSSENAYVIGWTHSVDFPTLNQYQTDPGDNTYDAFVTKLDTNGSGISSLIYSTYLGGGDMDGGLGIAVDNIGNAYVTGWTTSTDFPTLNQYQGDQPGYDVFVTKLIYTIGPVPPHVTTTAVSSITVTSASSGGNVFSDGGAAVTARGVCWSTSPNPTISDSHTTDGTGTGTFISTITGLIPSTTYHVRAYATNSVGISYGSDVTFTTIPVAPTVITTAVSGITSTSASSGGNVTSDGGAAVTARGVCWSTSPNPTISDSHTTDGTGIGTFISSITGLTPLTTYHVRAYAKNSVGTSYGSDLTFTTAANPTISGTVTDGTNPIKGVTITFSHDGHKETTNVNGNYSYTVDYGTTTTVTPGKTGYGSWKPANRTFKNIKSDKTQNFTGSLDTFTISGTVTDGTNPIKGVTITFSHDGHKETTNVNGNYSYTVDFGTTTTVTPSKTGYGSWKPAKKTFKNITSDKTQNFTGSLDTCTISGTVTDGTNPIVGVTITFSHDGHTETTDSDGNYSYSVEYGTSTTVTAKKQGYTFTPSEYSFTNLTEDKPNQDFTTGNYVSVTITNPQNEDTVSGAVTVTAEVSSKGSSAEYASVLSVTKVKFYIDGELEKQDSSSPYRYRWDTTLVANGNHTIKAKAFHSSGLTGEHEITVHVNNSTEPPHIDLNRTRLNFGAIIGESKTGSQTFLIENSGGCCLNWTAAVSDTWIHAAPLSGTANMLVTVSIDVTGLAKGSYSGTVTITDTNADNSPASVDIYLEVMEKAQELPLFGSFDSPVDGSEVFSSIPVTGWALDDVEVSKVKIYRNPIEGHEIGLVYIGDAVFVEGARPDVEEKYPGYPKSCQAGWGYMMLTNKLPNNGNGTFVIIAVATDSSGNEVTLGSKTITCDNEHAVKPFGTIDTPSQGGDASGMDFVNFGWALTPQQNTIPTDGSTIKVWVDGVPLAGSPVYNQYREDIATLFPGYNNSDGAVGYYFLDTTLYANGVHTIAWSVKDNAGNIDGIGSRYFRILNVVNKTNGQTYHKYNSVDVLNMNNSSAPVFLKRGYDHDSEPQILYPDKQGIIDIVIKEDERIEIGLRDQRSGSTRYFGYLAIGQELRRLPIGSFLDSSRGIFYWHPGPVFIGKYSLVFIEKGPNGKTSKKQIRITIK